MSKPSASKKFMPAGWVVRWVNRRGSRRCHAGSYDYREAESAAQFYRGDSSFTDIRSQDAGDCSAGSNPRAICGTPLWRWRGNEGLPTRK